MYCGDMYCGGMITLTAMSSRLVGRAELMLLLGVGRSRAVTLSESDTFPKPRNRLIMGNVWELDDVMAWAAARGRTLDLDALTSSVQADPDSEPQGKRVP